jgi:geranylgeranyl diphosphate synthase type II
LDSSLDAYLCDKRALVDRALDAALPPREGCPDSLRQAMRYSLLAPGKRLRPLLVILACEACGGSDRDALPAACAVEMVHTYSLIHDDLPAMDDDDLRRGRPTCHKQFGEALAILAGDALLTLAFEVLAEGYSALAAAGCTRELARGAGACGMVGGQVVDLASEGRLTATTEGERSGLEQLEALHGRKTGALFRSALRMGLWATLGTFSKVPPDLAESSTMRILDDYGRRFGLAFQITDDLLDVEGSADQTGKRVRKDAGRGKLTYPGLLGVADSRRRAERLCREACEVLAPLGPAANRLAQLARYVVERDR